MDVRSRHTSPFHQAQRQRGEGGGKSANGQRSLTLCQSSRITLWEQQDEPQKLAVAESHGLLVLPALPQHPCQAHARASSPSTSLSIVRDQTC
jgi:hypothetical protein